MKYRETVLKSSTKEFDYKKKPPSHLTNGLVCIVGGYFLNCNINKSILSKEAIPCHSIYNDELNGY